jgi:hypothetical protein
MRSEVGVIFLELLLDISNLVWTWFLSDPAHGRIQRELPPLVTVTRSVFFGSAKIGFQRKAS